MLVKLIYSVFGVFGVFCLVFLLNTVSSFTFKKLIVSVLLFVLFFTIGFYLPLYFTI